MTSDFVYGLHNAVEKACKKVISVLIPEHFYRTLKTRYTQFANVTTLTILTHLLTEYGQLSDQAVQDNDALMKKDINGETDFEDLVLQIEDALENVASQNPYIDQQVVSISFTIVERCGFYHFIMMIVATGKEKPRLTKHGLISSRILAGLSRKCGNHQALSGQAATLTCVSGR